MIQRIKTFLVINQTDLKFPSKCLTVFFSKTLSKRFSFCLVSASKTYSLALHAGNLTKIFQFGMSKNLKVLCTTFFKSFI